MNLSLYRPSDWGRLLIFFMGVVPLAAAGLEQVPIARVVYCQSLLIAADQVAQKLDPIDSLKTVMKLLKPVSNPKLPVIDYSPYASVSGLSSLLDSRIARRRLNLRAKIRLWQLQEDILRPRKIRGFVGFEIRGDEIKKFLPALETELTTTQGLVRARLEQQFPPVRLGSFVHGAVTSTILSYGIGLAAFTLAGDPISQTCAGCAVGSLAIAHEAFRFFNFAAVEKMAFTQVQAIGQYLQNPRPESAPFYITSNSFTSDTEFNRQILWQGSRPTLESTAHSARMMTRNFWEELLGFPGLGTAKTSLGAPLEIFYDSVFFVDSRTQEPVWLIFYRAMEPRISAPLGIGPHSIYPTY